MNNTDLQTQEPQFAITQSPVQVIEEAHVAAKMLMQLVKQNGWSVKVGQGEHLQFEAWQTVAKFYGLSVRTKSTEYVEYGKAKGFNAVVEVLDKDGNVVGGAESMCLDDEYNWKSKPLFSLKSMAQTRAAGKSLRQMLSWVVVLAGFKPTPAEEMSHLQPQKSDEQEAIEQMREAKRNPFNKEADWIEGKVTNEDISEEEVSRIAAEIDPLTDNTECTECHTKGVPQNVVDFSQKKYGRTLCFSCQKKVA